MSFSDFANFVGRRAAASAKVRPTKAYDDLAGSRLLRRAGKAEPAAQPPWREPTATLLAARTNVEPEDRVSRQLRDYYQSLAREPVPERFMQLMDDLEAGKKP
jgi:hypothetical protein